MNANHLRIRNKGRGLVTLLLLVLMGCSSVSHSNVANSNQPSNANENGGTAMDEQNHKPANDTVDTRLVSANTRFGLKLFAEVARQGGGKNVFISPASVGLALAMTYIGAVAETKAAMERTLETQGMNHAELNQANAELRDAIEVSGP